MASAVIHEVIALEVNKKYGLEETLLRLGTVSPDSWRNAKRDSGIKDKTLSHFWNFRIKDGEAIDYEEFYLKYYSEIYNPFYFGYLIHLIADKYWKTNVCKQYEITIDDKKCFLLKDGNIHSSDDYFGYYEDIKIQKQLSKIYHLSKLPTSTDEIPNFNVSIKELDLSGLFGKSGTVNYINQFLLYEDGDLESNLYDNESILDNIKKTVLFIEEELERLKEVKKEYDSKVKIAVDIDDTILCSRELEDYYWKEFLKLHPEIDSRKIYKWDDSEISLFYEEYREKVAFGKVKDGVSFAFKELLESGYIVDLITARPITKYSGSLKKQLVEYFEENKIEYNPLLLGYYTKADYLKEHEYDILIDNELRHVLGAQDEGIASILYGDFNKEYNGYQTNDWFKIPEIVNSIITSKNK